jgi:hypothetical protein
MFGVFAGASALFVTPMLAQPGGGAREKQGTWWKFTTLGFKFEGADTCGGSNCHGGGNTNFPPEKEGSPGSQYNIWQANDKHANAAKQVSAPELDKHPWMKDIGSKLGISGPLLSDAKCVSCHATQVPDNLKGAKYNVSEGVTCYHCHGPSEKWGKPHAEKGWTQKMRDSKPHDALLKEWGLYDTKSVMHRAEMCASCHLSIDASLVKAGHPQPIFEQVTFQTNEPQHWVDPTGYYVSKLWAAGQVIALRDAMTQLATRATGGAEEAYVKQAYDQATTHLAMVDAILAAKLIDGDKAALDAAAKSLADKPDAAAAASVAKIAETLATKINDAQPDKAKTLAVLNAVAGNADLVTKHGRRAAEQQYYALYNLYAAAYASAEGVGEADYKVIDDLLLPLGEQVPLEDKTKEVDAAKFTADLAKAATALKALK